MNIAVINIKDLIKALLVIALVIIIIISGIIIVNGKEELEEEIAVIDETKDSSFLYCLGMEIPLMIEENENEDEEGEKNKVNSLSKILDTELEMMYNIKEAEEKEEKQNLEIAQETGEALEAPKKEEEEQKTIEGTDKIDTKVIEENNIAPSYTDEKNDIQIKNQSKYDTKEILENSNYELKNKNKVIIYHTHTCESYTSSEKYNYQMTGAYRTTDLNYTVARVRRRARISFKAIWKNSCA